MELEITASFTPASHVNIPFGGTTVQSTFNSNIQSVFKFLSLPVWITPDKETFVNGDVITFTIAPNAVLFSRSITLTAFTEDYDGITAGVTLQQLHDTSTPPPDPEFLEVSDDDVELNYPSGSNVAVSVNASGAYTISILGAFSFAAVKESGDLAVRISAPSINDTGVNRTGIVRLTLNANPAVFVDIDVTQIFRPNLMVNVSPALDQTVGEASGSFSPFVVCFEPTVQWQAVAANPDSAANLIFDTSVKTGSQSFPVFAFGRPPYVPAGRELQINFINILNPSDFLTYIVQQN